MSAMDVSDAISLDEAVRTAIRMLEAAITAVANAKDHEISTLVVAWVCFGGVDESGGCITRGDRDPATIEFITGIFEDCSSETDLPALSRRLS